MAQSAMVAQGPPQAHAVRRSVGPCESRPRATGERARGRGLLRTERYVAGRAVDRDLELVEEVTPEEAVGVRLVDVVGDDHHLPDAGVAHLERVDAVDLDVGRAGRATDRPARARRARRRAGGDERARGDDRAVGPGVQNQAHARRLVDARVRVDALARREWDDRARALARRGAGRRRRRSALRDERARGGAEAFGHAVEALGVVRIALLVGPPVDLGTRRPGLDGQDDDQQDGRDGRPEHRANSSAHRTRWYTTIVSAPAPSLRSRWTW